MPTRYWPTREQEQQLIQRNFSYQEVSGLGEMLMSVLQRPTDGEEGQWMSLKDISARLKKVFKGAYSEDEGSYVRIGNYLSRPEYKFESQRKTSGMVYWVKLR